MKAELPSPKRYFGLDLHKHYLVATAVDADLNQLYGPKRVELVDIEKWAHKTLSPKDAVVVEMTANTWQIYDELEPYVHSITIVHPPHVTLIVRAQVMTDKIAAYQLARLHAKGLLVGIWIPPQEIRDLRTLVAQRKKILALKTQAKNRLHAVLHRHHIPPPADGKLFEVEKHDWWLSLPVSALETICIQSDWDTLIFAYQQIANIEKSMAAWAAHNDQIPYLLQCTGIGLINAVTIIAAVGDISRFPDAKHLVGYAGMGSRVHDSGQTTRLGKITKAGRKDLRSAMVEAAQTAVLHDRHWRAELTRLEPRLGRSKAIVAIARRMLVAVWHILTKQTIDRHSNLDRLARKYYEFAYTIGKANRPGGQTAAEYVRCSLDRLGIGDEIKAIKSGSRRIKMPPSKVVHLPECQ